MGTPAGTFLPTGGFDPNAELARRQGQLANMSSFANSGIGPGSTMQAVAGTGTDLNAAETAFNDYLNNSLVNVQTANNKFGGANGLPTQFAGGASSGGTTAGAQSVTG